MGDSEDPKILEFSGDGFCRTERPYFGIDTQKGVIYLLNLKRAIDDQHFALVAQAIETYRKNTRHGRVPRPEHDIRPEVPAECIARLGRPPAIRGLTF